MMPMFRGKSLRGMTARAGCLLGVFLCAQSPAQAPPAKQPIASSTEQVPIEVFQGPRDEHPVALPYPFDESNDNEEGSVTLSFMVDPSGKASEIAIMESTGNKDFEKSAVSAVEKTAFSPATLNGQPIESAYEIRYNFVSPIAPNAATAQFLEAYKALTAAIQAKDRPAADAAMRELKV